MGELYVWVKIRNMSDTDEQDKPICIRCGHANDYRASRCAECKSPLDDFSASSPWEMGSATSSAYSSPQSPRTKPIIFWGVWLIFGPSAFSTIKFICTSAYALITGDEMMVNDDGELLVGLILVMVASLLFGAFSIWVLWSVTKGYFTKEK